MEKNNFFENDEALFGVHIFGDEQRCVLFEYPIFADTNLYANKSTYTYFQPLHTYTPKN